MLTLRTGHDYNILMPILLSVVAAALFGAADFLCGLAARTLSTLRILAIAQAAGLLTALIALLAGLGGPLSGSDAAFAALAGLSGVLGLGFLYRGLASSSISIVSPLSALLAAFVPALYGVLTGERPGPTASVGMLVCIPAILLLTLDTGRREEPCSGNPGHASRLALDPVLQEPRHQKHADSSRSLFFGAAAGVFLGGFYLLISRCGPESEISPLVLARASSLAAILVASLVLAAGKRHAAGPRRSGSRTVSSHSRLTNRYVLMAFSGGVFDMLANAAYLGAARQGLLMIVSIVSSLFPVPTVLLARIVLKERIPGLRLAGIGLSLVGMILTGL